MADKLLSLFLIASFLVALYAWFLIVIDAFRYSTKHGLACLFIPFYADVFMFRDFEHERKGAVITAMLVFQCAALGTIVHSAVDRYRLNVAMKAAAQELGQVPDEAIVRQAMARPAEARDALQGIVSGVLKYMRQRQEVEVETLRRISVGHMVESHKEFVSPSELPVSATPVPSTLQQLKGSGYQSQGSDWIAPGWNEIRFYSKLPQAFQYRWERTSPFTGVARVIGDENHDGTEDVRWERTVECIPPTTAPGTEPLRCRASP